MLEFTVKRTAFSDRDGRRWAYNVCQYSLYPYSTFYTTFNFRTSQQEPKHPNSKLQSFTIFRKNFKVSKMRMPCHMFISQ